jgi:ABC-type phosphate/phosphonate transport system permease subunit
MGGYFVNRDLNEGSPNDDQSSGQGQSPATPGVFFGFAILFALVAIWATINAAWVGVVLSLAVAIAFAVAGARKQGQLRRD